MIIFAGNNKICVKMIEFKDFDPAKQSTLNQYPKKRFKYIQQ